jgi:DNA polymerase alpha subunit A
MNALAALKAKREGGTGAGVRSFKNDAGSGSDNDIYDEVSEDEYKSIVRGRMMQDDFIEDDDGSGYVDDGRDDWNTHATGEHDDEDDDSEDADDYYERTGRRKKKKRSKDPKMGKQNKNAVLADAFAKRPNDGRKMNAAPAPFAQSRQTNAMDAYRPAVATEKEDDFMARLMGGLVDGDIHSVSPSVQRAARTIPISRKRKQEAVIQQPSFQHLRRRSITPPSSDPLDPPSDGVHPDVHVTGSDTPPWSAGKDLVIETDLPTSKRVKAASQRIGSLGIRDEDEDSVEDTRHAHNAAAARRARSQSRIDPSLFDAMDDDINMDDDDIDMFIKAPAAAKNGLRIQPAAGINAKSVRQIAQPIVVKKEEVDDILMMEPKTDSPSQKPLPSLKNSWRSIGAKLANVENAAPASVDPKAAIGSTASTSKISAYEPDSRRLRFFWLDYVEQQGIIYLIGKVKDHNTGRFVSACLQVEGVERCVYLMPREGASEDDVYEEFDSIRAKHGIKSFLAKYVTRKYAFEMPDVPAEGEYLKVRYGFDEPQLPLDLQGKTFSRIFGANTSAFELFVIKRRIMGPCWLDVESADLRNGTPLSWCKIEFSVDDAKFIKPFSDSDASAPRDTPPLSVMSISVRTVVNHKENKREVVAVAARTWKDVQIEDPTPPEDVQSTLFSVVRPLSDMFPPGFEQEAKSGATKVTTVKYERMLLNTLLAQIQQQDPDVIVGHDFSGVSLDILLHRMRDLRADHWSRIGRLRRQKWPTLKQGFNLRLVSGRLLCDLASDTARGMITSTTWSLTEMCSSHLKMQREDIDPDDMASFFDPLAPTGERLMSFVRHNEVDAYFQMALACKVQILGLTKQLTNLAGNSWSRTLNGGRAERNEYILLHEFHRQKYICPDKLNKSERDQLARQQQKQDDDDDDENGEARNNTVTKKDKYKGGLVFDPKRGLWDKYILVMDFNSLYPSQIQEFNIDFTTVDRKACNENADDVDRMPEIPSSDVGQGVLPRLISTLVARRRQVKSLMKDRNAAPAKQLQWNIKQLALKLTANSMYGCLGFEGSRFFARPLAALTTFKGREVLTSTKELAESLGLDVIYGDTDSVMINTNVLDLVEAKRIGVEFKKAVNDRYKLLEIDIDGVFERMLLLQKKKYAAIKIEEDEKRVTEIKGLDMKRREYCALSKNVSGYVLEQILSGEATETVVEQIHEYLESVAQDMDKVALEDFIIYKRLSKKVSEYNEQAAKSLPHVQVAKRMQAKGVTVRMGDVIPYVFCLDDSGNGGTKSAQAERAYHPDDLRRKDSTLKVDMQHYLSLQILPPIERLCESIVGTDRSRLAEHLGLDGSKYQSISLHPSGAADDRQFVTLDSQTPDEVRFEQCERLVIDCPQCNEAVTFSGLPGLMEAKSEDDKAFVRASRLLAASGLACPTCDCAWSPAFVAVRLDAMIRRHVARYYQAWTTCTEPSCGTSSRLQGVSAKRCLVNGCRGKVVLQYGDKALYDQLCFLETLFDGQRALERAQGNLSSATAAISNSTSSASEVAAQNLRLARQRLDVLQNRLLHGSPSRHALSVLHNTCQRYTARSGRRIVALESLFGWMKVAGDV